MIPFIFVLSISHFLTTAKKNLRLQQLVTFIGVILFIVKLLAWWLTGSVAILTDALESTVNVIAGLIGTYSLYISAKPRDKEHPYGHGKAEFISAAVEGTLITVAGFVIIYEAINNLIHPHVIQQLDYGMALVAGTGIINFIVGSICVRAGKKNNSLVLISGGRHLQTDTWSTLGIIVGLVLLYFLQYPWIDSAVAIIFSFIIMFTGYKIVRTSVAGIMDEADETLIKKIVHLLNENRRDQWIDLHNLRIIQYGSTLHVDCHLTLPWYFNMHEAHDEVDQFTDLLKNDFGDATEFFVHTDGCLDFSCPLCSKKDCTVRKHPFEQQVEWTPENIIRNKKHRL